MERKLWQAVKGAGLQPSWLMRCFVTQCILVTTANLFFFPPVSGAIDVLRQIAACAGCWPPMNTTFENCVAQSGGILRFGARGVRAANHWHCERHMMCSKLETAGCTVFHGMHIVAIPPLMPPLNHSHPSHVHCVQLEKWTNTAEVIIGACAALIYKVAGGLRLAANELILGPMAAAAH